MVYTKLAVSNNIDAALATNPNLAAKDMQAEKRAYANKPEDFLVCQNAAFDYLFKIQQNPSFIPDFALLNVHLSWIAANKSNIAAQDLANLLNIVRNIVGSAQHEMTIRLRMQTFKREQMQDYSDTDPIEASLFNAFNKMATVTTKGELDALKGWVRSVDSLIPTTI